MLFAVTLTGCSWERWNAPIETSVKDAPSTARQPPATRSRSATLPSDRRQSYARKTDRRKAQAKSSVPAASQGSRKAAKKKLAKKAAKEPQVITVPVARSPGLRDDISRIIRNPSQIWGGGRVRRYGGPAPTADVAATVRVYFGTDRNRTASTDPQTYYGHERAAVSYGYSDVTVPRAHAVGRLETPSVFKFEFSPNPAKHIVVASITSMGSDDFFSQLRAESGRLSERQAFVFVHGYANDFHEATRRAAQMKYDLNFPGLAIIYSWPSVGSESAYGLDADSIEWSTDNLRQFLRDIAERSGAEEIFLIGHSMGTRGLAAAVAGLTSNAPREISARYRQLILAAPDIDRDIFKDRIFPAIKAAGMNVTLYASDRDKALDLSKIGRGPGRAFPRLGTTSPSPFVAEGISTIDAGPVDTSFWGHRYYAENRSIISDIYYLIRGVPVLNRFGIEQINDPGGGYWRFKQ